MTFAAICIAAVAPSMFLIVYFLIALLRRRAKDRVGAAKAAAVQAASLAAAEAQAALTAREKALRAEAAAAALDLAIVEQAAFETVFNTKSRIRYDDHLRRRAVMFRLKVKLGRDLTAGEIVAVKERVS